MNRDSVNQRNSENTQGTFLTRDVDALAQGESPRTGMRVEPVVKTRQHGDFHEVMGVDG